MSGANPSVTNFIEMSDLLYDKITSKMEDINTRNWEKTKELFYEQNTIIKNQNKEINELQQKNKYLLKENKRRNVVIYGMEEGENNFSNLLFNVLDVFNLMNLEINKYEVDMCFRLGKYKGKNRPILVKFITQWRKEEVMRQRSLLKGKHLYIENDLSKEEIENVRQLKQRMMQERDAGKFAVVKGSELVVNGQKRIKADQSEIEDGKLVQESKCPVSKVTMSKQNGMNVQPKEGEELIVKINCGSRNRKEDTDLTDNKMKDKGKDNSDGKMKGKGKEKVKVNRSKKKR